MEYFSILLPFQHTLSNYNIFVLEQAVDSEVLQSLGTFAAKQ